MTRERKPQTHDTTLFWLTLATSIVGLVFILDAGYAQGLRINNGILPRPFIAQIAFLVIGIIAFLALRFSKPERLKRNTLWWVGLAFLGLILVEIIGVKQNGARRWIGTDAIKVQPAEFMKVGAILFLAWALEKKASWQSTWQKRKQLKGWASQVFWPKFRRFMPALVILVACGFVEHEKDLGTASVILATSIAMFMSAPVTWKSVAATVGVLAIGLTLMVWKEPYRLERFMVHPKRWEKQYINDESFQTIHSELAMASGGLNGAGFGNGRAKHILPATTSDFVMATVAEETGIWGVAACLGLVGGICMRLMSMARKTQDKFRSRFMIGVAWWIGIQACTNLMMANATLPAIGIPFPFIS
ncbi:MAG TPA: FtsW/RodA/SpoVE family cell cycle protein, partial [Fimbriimonas sp.]|nr:FtsW/RodA/SpoVE family cell cycle protein [Fimbriimonas sp.]